MNVGIIGGADGPTAVIVALSPIEPWMIIAGACAVAAIVTALILILKRKK